LARAREHQYPLPSFGVIEDAQHRCRQVHEDRLRRRLETGNRGSSALATNGAGGFTLVAPTQATLTPTSSNRE
jgi:hypothetical protein